MNDRPDNETPKSLPSSAQSSYDASMEARVAVLEEIARNTEKMLERVDARIARIEERQVSDVRLLLLLGFGATSFICTLMGHGFHWF